MSLVVHERPCLPQRTRTHERNMDMENVVNRYPVETLDSEYDDDGTMPANVDTLREAVVGRKIIAAEKAPAPEDVRGWVFRGGDALRLTLDNGTQVWLADTDDCCAYTALAGFLLDPAGVDHRIMGVGTTEGYTVWHIYADYGDVLKLMVGWSCGNPFYYGYGFDIKVLPVTVDADVIGGELE